MELNMNNQKQRSYTFGKFIILIWKRENANVMQNVMLESIFKTIDGIKYTTEESFMLQNTTYNLITGNIKTLVVISERIKKLKINNRRNTYLESTNRKEIRT